MTFRRHAPLLPLVLTACIRFALPPSGAQPECRLESDCASRHICAAGQCRASCRTDRDCPDEERCRPSTQEDAPVCLPVDAEALCVFNSDCPAPRVCGVDQHCHGQCAADVDCAAGSHCDVGAGTCADVLLVGQQTSPCACDASERCDHGTCVPTTCPVDGGPCNDACEGAELLVLASGTTSFAFVADGYTASLPTCIGQRNGYYRFRLESESLVVVNDRLGAGFDHRVGLLDGCGEATPVTCAATCVEAVVAKVLPAGDHLIVVEVQNDFPDVRLPFEVFVLPVPPGSVMDVIDGPPFAVDGQLGGINELHCAHEGATHGWFLVPQCPRGESWRLSSCTSDDVVLTAWNTDTGQASSCSAADAGCQVIDSADFGLSRVLVMKAVGPAGSTVHVTGSFQ